VTDPSDQERVTGIGGVFFRARDPEALAAWYQTHLGVPMGEDGFVTFAESRDTHWVPFPEDTTYWPADRQAMLNFTVRDLDAMVAQLRAGGVDVDVSVEEHEYGRFGWLVDPEGNRVELWEAPRRDES